MLCIYYLFNKWVSFARKDCGGGMLLVVVGLNSVLGVGREVTRRWNSVVGGQEEG